ncbi:MAG: hypothetical protein WCT04_18880 [Planctomycetota bacterium]
MRCLIVGGGGPVGISLLYILKNLGWSAAVVDPRRPMDYAAHQKALGSALEKWTIQHYSMGDFQHRVSAEKFDAVIDLTPTLDKRATMTYCDNLGIPLVNSTMVDYKDDIHIAAFNFICERPHVVNQAHVAASGMNPGALNAMAEEIIQTQLDGEAPDEIVYWEYDDTIPANGKFPGPSTTWCPGESGAELTEDWTFEVLEEGSVLLHEDALSWTPQSYRGIGVPFKKLPIPADGDAFLCGHEECLYMGWRHDTAVKFIYGFHAENMKLIRGGGYNQSPELLIREPEMELHGTDYVGVAVRDGDTWYGQYCTFSNSPELPTDTNATCWLVASGMAASVLALAKTKTKPGVYLTHEMPGWMEAFRSLIKVHEYTVSAKECS